jgi:hypothetical protein
MNYFKLMFTILVNILVLSLPLMLLWNYAMPSVLGFDPINYLESCAILSMISVLKGDFQITFPYWKT